MCQYYFFKHRSVKKVRRLSQKGTGNYNYLYTWYIKITGHNYVQAGFGPDSIIRNPDPRFSIEIFTVPEHNFF
jgi:hypothetical protein